MDVDIKFLVHLRAVLEGSKNIEIIKIDDAYVLLKFSKETAMLLHLNCQERTDLDVQNSKNIEGTPRHFVWFIPCPCCMYHTSEVYREIDLLVKKDHKDLKTIIVHNAAYVKEHYTKKYDLNILDKSSPYGGYETVEKYLETLPPIWSFEDNPHLEVKVYAFGLVCTIAS